mmetsp:Transcript_24775/g.36335  ORF Transcript_24775/g.36335 Transcript_24775/m.36335 type:complete len:112 (+) Transcript_24775:268-603(+)
MFGKIWRLPIGSIHTHLHMSPSWVRGGVGLIFQRLPVNTPPFFFLLFFQFYMFTSATTASGICGSIGLDPLLPCRVLKTDYDSSFEDYPCKQKFATIFSEDCFRFRGFRET